MVNSFLPMNNNRYKQMKINILSCFLTFVLGVMMPLQAQVYQHFTKENGLQGHSIYRVYQDSSGFIWLASPDGVSRFDGTSFIHFNAQNGLPNNDIWQLLPDNKNRIWYFTKAQQLGYIKNDKIFKFANQENIPFYPQHLYQSDTLVGFYSRNPSNPKYFYLADTLWKTLPTQKTWGHYLDLTRKYFYSYRNAHMLIVDSAGKQLLSIPDLEKDSEHDKRQVNDSIFINLYDDQILYVNTKRLDYKLFKLPKPLKTSRVTLFDNQIQVSSEDQLYLFDLNLNLLNTYTSPKKVEAIFHFLDRDHNLWVATLNDGLYFFPKMNRELQTFFPDERIKNVLVFNHELYVHTDQKGYFKFSSQNSIPKKILDFGVVGQMNLTHQGKGIVMINNDEIYTQLPNEKEGKIHKTPQKYLSELSFHNGNWFNVGLSTLKISKDFTQAKEILPYDASQHITATQNELFVGGVNGLKIWQEPNFRPFITQDSLHLRTITGLEWLDENRVLVGTENRGLYVVSAPESKKLLDTKGEIVKHIFVENKTHIWIVSNSCLIRLQSDDFWEKGVTGQDRFCYPFLLLQNGLNAFAILDQTLYLATDKGLLSLPYDDVFSIPKSEFYVKSISFNQEDFSPGAQYTFDPANNLNIQLATLQYLPHQPQVYEYRLLPNQQKWIQLENNNLTLSGFEPDNYTLELRQVGLKSSRKLYKFEIVPKWWQSKFFNIVLLLSIIALTSVIAIFIVKSRFKIKERRLEQLKTQTEHELHALRSQMNPHFIFNSLNAIQFYLNDKGTELTEKYLIIFSKLIRMIFEYSGKKTVTLTEEIQLLQSYLELEKMRFGDKLSFYIFTDSKIDSDQCEIPSLLLQPIVENAVNHGIFHSDKLGLISIKFNRKNEQTLEVVIEDNGVGMAKTRAIYENSFNKHTSKSTQILQNRIDLLNQTGQFYIEYRVQDLENKITSGTRVTLIISLSKK